MTISKSCGSQEGYVYNYSTLISMQATGISQWGNDFHSEYDNLDPAMADYHRLFLPCCISNNAQSCPQ